MAFNFISKYRNFEDSQYRYLLDAVLFVIITYGFHLLFKYYAAEIMAVPGIARMSQWLADQVYSISLWFNRNILGFSIITEPGNTMWFLNGNGVTVNTSCSGMKQFYQVVILFLLFPGPWKHKTWFIPMAVAIMFVTNVFRIVVLSIVQSHWPQYFEFCHTWVLRPFFYVVIFALWVWWVEKFRRQKTSPAANSKK